MKRSSMSIPFLTFASPAMLVALLSFGCIPRASADDSGIRNITNDPTGVDYMPEFSPDGRVLIFERAALIGSHRFSAYVVPSAGGDIKPLSTNDLPVEQTRMRWSPKGNLIAFTGIETNRHASTWLMDKDGSHIHRAPSSQAGDAVYPSWYPDGQRILETIADNNTLQTININTGTSATIQTTPSLLTGMATVSPDGKWIAAAAQLRVGKSYNQEVNQIWIIDSLGRAHPLLKSPHEGRAPTWSPDGSKVVFESNEGSANPGFYAIFVANADGSGLRQLTPFDHNTQHPVFSPDGKWIAFSERADKLIGAHAQSVAVMPAP